VFDEEVRAYMADGYVLVGRVGHLGGHELRARADRPVERVDHEAFVQLVASRDAREVIVRVEEPGLASPRVLVLARDEGAAPSVLVQVGPLYLGGSFRVVERIDDPEAAEARWQTSGLGACWVSDPAGKCC
jgi:hypothetical protein